MRVSGLLLKVLAYPCLLFKVLSEYDLFLFSFTSQAIPPGTEGGGERVACMETPAAALEQARPCAGTECRGAPGKVSAKGPMIC